MAVKRNSDICRFYQPLPRLLILCLVLGGLFIYSAPLPADDLPETLFKEYQGVIALDPGHGGKNEGVHGADEIFEKEICLDLARRITTLMEPDYRIILTRSDDYDVPLTERTATANNQNADMLISIHTAAAFMQATNGIDIYTYKPATDRKKSKSTDIISWYRQQEPHMAESQNLAAKVRNMLQSMPGAPEITTFQAPLVILEGADMPAILIEVGYLTNPADHKRLADPQNREIIAQAIVKGIENYLVSIRK